MIYGNVRYDVHGRKRKVQRKRRTVRRVHVPIVENKSTCVEVKPYRRETVEYRSVDDRQVCTGRVERQVYTGTVVKGISVMHKSNLVPIIDQEQAIDIARMRR